MSSTTPSTQVQTLPRTPEREAIATLLGYSYQVWVSIDQWFALSAKQVLFLEGAEDIDRVSTLDANTVQVRHTQGSISLNTAYAKKAIKQYWDTKEREVDGREIHYTYLTTSEIATETNAQFDGRTGIATWKHARYDTTAAETLRNYLLSNLDAQGALLTFLRDAVVDDLQKQLFSRFEWVTAAPSLDVVKDTVLARLTTRLSANNYPRESLVQIRDRLFTHCWDQICQPELGLRVLTAASLERQIDEATTVHFTLPSYAMGSVVMAAAQLYGLQGHAQSLAQLAEAVPIPPHPLLNRTALVNTVTTHVRLRESVLLTGSVYKGKTTIAILTARATHANAWWVDLADRQDGVIRDIFDLLTALIETDAAPQLVVFDDLNTSQTARKIYKKSLSKLLYRATRIGKTVLLTAQGSSEIFEKEELTSLGLVVLDVPSMTTAEIQAECVDAGCIPETTAELWAALISVQTAGHPKLVHVRIKELSDTSWPAFDMQAFVGHSNAVQNAKQLARSLFSETVSAAEAEFVYTAAEFAILPSREMLLNLADLSPEVQGVESLLHKLSGKWIETIAPKYYRVTPMLKAVLGETWSGARHQRAHRIAYDAIANCKLLNPSEGAALVYHSLVSREAKRLMKACFEVVQISDESIKVSAYKHLSWLTAMVGLGGKSIFPEDERGALMLRGLQFAVASAQNSTQISQIVEEWKAEIAKSTGQIREDADIQFTFSILTTQAQLSPKIIFECATWAHFAGVNGNPGVQMFDEFRTKHNLLELPKTATTFQEYLAIKLNMVAGYDDFCELTNWLEDTKTPELLCQFDAMLSWSILNVNGAFVHHGWIAETKLANPNWERWKAIIEKTWAIALTKSLPALGCELARALSVIYCEQLADFPMSIAVLTKAESDFGASPILDEQRANAYFQNKQFSKALEAWSDIERKFGANENKDPFAFRRMALAAIELERWEEATSFFLDAANTLPPKTEMPIKCSLLAEAALTISTHGNRSRATDILMICFDEIPKLPLVAQSPPWEATLRFIVAITAQVRGQNALTTEGTPFIVKPGMASNPQHKMPSTDNNHALRMGMLELNIFVEQAALDGPQSAAARRIVALLASNDLLLRREVALSLIMDELKSTTTERFVVLVESYIEATEKLRKNTPSAAQTRDLEVMAAGFYLLAAVCDAKPNEVLFAQWGVLITDGNYALTKSVLIRLQKAFSDSSFIAKAKMFDANADLLERCSAALSILRSDARDAQATVGAQAILIMAINRCGVLKALKDRNIEQLLTKKLALTWNDLPMRPHLFRTPRITLPPLKDAIRLALENNGTLKQLLTSGAAASGVAVGTILKELSQ